MKKLTVSALIAVSWLTLRCAAEPSDGQPTDTRTNWLKECTSDQECGGELKCECGICSRACESAAECTDLAESAICSTPDGCSKKLCLDGSGTGGGGSGGSNGADGGGSALAGSPNAGASSGGASNGGSPTGGFGGAGSESGGTGSIPNGPLLGEICYDSDSTAPTLICGEGYCDSAQTCTDREPPHCTSVCTCHDQGEVCRQVNEEGTVTLNQTCCDGLECLKNGLASGAQTEIFTCELPGTLACNLDCQVHANDTSCGSDPASNVVWTCRVAPAEVLEQCQDRATQIPSWCCPSTVLPECIPE